MGFADDFRQLLLKIQEEEGSQLRAAQKLGVSNGAFSSWLSGARGKGHTALFTALDRAGARLVFPGQNLSSEDGGAISPAKTPGSERIWSAGSASCFSRAGASPN